MSWNLESIEDTTNKITKAIQSIEVKTEYVSPLQALNRILAEDITSDIDLPAYNKSIFDGYAIKQSEMLPNNRLKIIDLMSIESPFDGILGDNETVYIPTGGILPDNADRVIKIEDIQKIDDFIILPRTIPAYKGIMEKGEDMQKNELLLKKGTLLRPQDIGALCAIGCCEVNVKSKIRFSIISSGDEIIPYYQKPKYGQVRDINSSVLSALVIENGGEVVCQEILSDNYDNMLESIKAALEECDILLLSGGSSVGIKDYSSKLISEFGSILTHGISLKPGKPTIVAQSNCKNKILFGLPGHPASSAMVFQALIKPMMHKLLDRYDKYQLQITATVMEDIKSNVNRDVYQPVVISSNDNKTFVSPVYGKSGSIMFLCKSDGYIIVPKGQDVLKDDDVSINLF